MKTKLKIYMVHGESIYEDGEAYKEEKPEDINYYRGMIDVTELSEELLDLVATAVNNNKRIKPVKRKKHG
jgi:hypothetical protein